MIQVFLFSYEKSLLGSALVFSIVYQSLYLVNGYPRGPDEIIATDFDVKIESWTHLKSVQCTLCTVYVVRRVRFIFSNKFLADYAEFMKYIGSSTRRYIAEGSNNCSLML